MSDSQGSVAVHSKEDSPVPPDDLVASPLECELEGPDSTSIPEDDTSLIGHDPESLPSRSKGRPLFLHPLVGWGLIFLCTFLTIIIVILYWLSQIRHGLFTVQPVRNFRDEVVQLAWSSGPTFFMTLITGVILAPLAFNLWLYAPYAELERGGATAQASILANYTILGPFRRIRLAWNNRRPGLVTLGVATLLSGLLTIAASGLFETRNIVVNNNVQVQVTASLGIAVSSDGVDDGQGDHIFLSSDQYLAAASFADGQGLYHHLPVPYTYWSTEGNWSITPLSLTTSNLPHLERAFDSSVLVANLTVETYGIEMSANCNMADVTFNSENTTVTATWDGCSYSFKAVVDETYTRWHFANSTPCSNASRYDIGFKTFVYAMYRPSDYVDDHPEKFVVMFCQPSISIAKVRATMSFTQQDGIGALVAPPAILEWFPIGSNTTDPNVARLLGPPLNGNAVNGYDMPEPLNATNLSREARVNVTRLILFEGIYGAMLDQMVTDKPTDPQADWFNPENRQQLGRIVSDFYQTYVSTFSRSAYFDPGANDTTINGDLTALSTRAFVSRLNAIALSVLFFLLASLLTVTQIKQPRPQADGDGVQLARNTLAHHAIASEGPLVEMMRPLSRLPHERMVVELKGRRFSTNQGKVVVHRHLK